MLQHAHIDEGYNQPRSFHKFGAIFLDLKASTLFYQTLIRLLEEQI